MSRKKRLVILGWAVGTTCLLSALLLTVAFTAGSRTSVPEQLSDTSTTTPLYTVGAYNGRVAVFLYGEAQPNQVLEEVFLRSLPAGDQQRLQEGIPVYNEEELWPLLEDLES